MSPSFLSLALIFALCGVRQSFSALVIGIIGDFGRGQDGDYTITASEYSPADQASMFAVGKALGLTCGKEKCDLVINVGDNFYDLGIDASLGVYDPQWETSFNNVYSGASLQKIKFYGVLGNHDYGRNGTGPKHKFHSIQPQLEFTSYDPKQRWYLPTRYYSVDVTKSSIKARISATDTSPFIDSYCKNGGSKYYTPELRYACNPTIRKGQLATFERSLKKAKADGDWSIAVGHHPMLGTGGTNQPLHDDLLPLIKKYTPQVWLNGHDHVLTHLKDPAAPKTEFFCIGASSIYESADLPSSDIAKYFPFAGKFPGFAVMKLYNTYGTISFYGVRNYTKAAVGTVLYSYSFKK